MSIHAATTLSHSYLYAVTTLLMVSQTNVKHPTKHTPANTNHIAITVYEGTSFHSLPSSFMLSRSYLCPVAALPHRQYRPAGTATHIDLGHPWSPMYIYQVPLMSLD